MFAKHWHFCNNVMQRQRYFTASKLLKDLKLLIVYYIAEDAMRNGFLRILHTADWHLGQLLYEKKRDDEFEFFLSWLAETIRDRKVDCLLVAGDIFDTSTPSSHIQELYYRYLQLFREHGCRHIVVTAGNHDPAILLEAPAALLRGMGVHVLGVPDTASPEKEVLVLRDKAGEPELVVCAVPFLRDKYIRKGAPGESPQEKEANLHKSIAAHYADVAEKARALRAGRNGLLPVVAMGHLFADENGRALKGDAERNLYVVGTLGQVGCDIFDSIFDYVALGHLHVAQAVDERGRIRYSGSPLPVGLGEAGQQKSVCLVELQAEGPVIETLPIPPYRMIRRIEGGLKEIESALEEIAASAPQPAAWLDIAYTGEEYPGNMRERLEDIIAGRNAVILRIDDRRTKNLALEAGDGVDVLAELEPGEVFEKCLAAHNVPESRWPDLIRAFNEVCAALHEEKE